MFIPRFAAAGLIFAALIAPAHAQNGESDPPAWTPDPRTLTGYEAEWSTPEIAMVARRLTGTWRTEEPIESMRNEDGQSVPVYLVMSVAPAPVSGLSDTLYVETARTDSPWSPYRRAIFQIFPYRDGLRLRTYELAVGSTAQGVFNGMFAAADHFPELSADELIATIDLDLSPTATGFEGASPYPYPTRLGGAVEMTSRVTLDGDGFSVADRGYDANGNVVWGAGEDSVFFFERTRGVVSTTRRDDGMVILDYGGASGPVVSNGDQMHVHYEGFLASKHRFDSSYDRDMPFIFAYPPGTRAITGWGIGMENFARGARRKLIIPGDLGYGPNGNPRAGIPGDATLYFNIHLVHIDRAQPDDAETDENGN
ncbi:MAG: CpcT/CpeT family chromophore lyase [Phycisphaerales bacterium]|nr:FKBP-type peptidyl-prolyl cis-trans isomerase [Planctomycetota bacterium]MCH8507239.1 CpcT/CpeT family chromophore lyase [Phycisphaerales bacterium]